MAQQEVGKTLAACTCGTTALCTISSCAGTCARYALHAQCAAWVPTRNRVLAHRPCAPMSHTTWLFGANLLPTDVTGYQVRRPCCVGSTTMSPSWPLGFLPRGANSAFKFPLKGHSFSFTLHHFNFFNFF